VQACLEDLVHKSQVEDVGEKEGDGSAEGLVVGSGVEKEDETVDGDHLVSGCGGEG